jgi:hypothetical protein
MITTKQMTLGYIKDIRRTLKGSEKDTAEETMQKLNAIEYFVEHSKTTGIIDGSEVRE